MKIIQEKEYHVDVQFVLSFNWNTGGGGFGFNCDEQGNVDLGAMNEVARKNYLDCVSGAIKVHRVGVERFENRWTSPRIGLCNVCGEEVYLDRFTNTCECGIDYNMSGQQLADRSQWGWETGETVADILSVDSEPPVYQEPTPLDEFDF